MISNSPTKYTSGALYSLRRFSVPSVIKDAGSTASSPNRSLTCSAASAARDRSGESRLSWRGDAASTFALAESFGFLGSGHVGGIVSAEAARARLELFAFDFVDDHLGIVLLGRARSTAAIGDLLFEQSSQFLHLIGNSACTLCFSARSLFMW